MMVLDSSFSEKMIEMGTYLQDVDQRLLTDDDILQIQRDLVNLLSRATLDIQFHPEMGFVISDDIRNSVEEAIREELKTGVYHFVLPPIPKLSGLEDWRVRKAADALSRKIVLSTTDAVPVPRFLSRNTAVVFVQRAPECCKFDYDNRAFKVYLDNIARVALESDTAQNIDLIQTYAPSDIEKTDVYLMEKSRFPSWIHDFYLTL